MSLHIIRMDVLVVTSLHTIKTDALLVMSLHNTRADALVVMSLHTIKMVALGVMSLHSHQNECIGFKKSIKQNGSGAKGRQRWGEARWFVSSQCASSLASNFTVSKFQAYSCHMF